MSSAFWIWMLPIFPEFWNNNRYKVCRGFHFTQRLLKTNHHISLDLCWFLEEELVWLFHSWHLPAIFSFLTSPLMWCLTSPLYLSSNPSLLVAASPIPSHLCGCPLTPKEVFLGLSQTQVCSSLISFTSVSNLQAASDFLLMLTGFLQDLPPPWSSPALYCQMSCLCPTEFFNFS